MRKTWNHVPPESTQPCPDDNMSMCVIGQVGVWHGDRRKLIHTESAMEIAAWWQGPRSPGLTAFASTGTITPDLLLEIAAARRTVTGADGDDLDALAAYVRAVVILTGDDAAYHGAEETCDHCTDSGCLYMASAITFTVQVEVTRGSGPWQVTSAVASALGEAIANAGAGVFSVLGSEYWTTGVRSRRA